MKTWSECCDEVGYNPQGAFDELQSKRVWYAYKKGVAQKFRSKLLALAYSNNIEEVEDDQSKVARENYWKARKQLEDAAKACWFESLKDEFNYLKPAVFKVCHLKAWEDSHANGLDEVYRTMEDLSDFTCNIIAANMDEADYQ